MANVVTTRYNLIKSDYPALDTAVAQFLRPLLRSWLAGQGLLAEAQQRSIDVYETPYDPRALTAVNPLLACLWTGYHTGELAYCKAHNDNTAFWFVPTTSAMPSLFYLFGQQVEPYRPRVSTMLQTPAEMLQHFKATEPVLRHDKSGKAKASGSELIVGLWYGYDASPNNKAKIAAFLRLFQALKLEYVKSGAVEKFPDLKFIILLKDKEYVDRDDFAGLDRDNDQLIELTFCYNVHQFIRTADVYVSFEDCPTCYDPLSTLCSNPELLMLNVAPVRMDMLGLNYIGLPDGLVNVLNALLAPSSPGTAALLNLFMPVYLAFVQQLHSKLTELLLPNQHH